MVTSLELDHVFVFTDPSYPEIPALERAGLVVKHGRAHPGQGTANRCVMFPGNYFELLTLTSEKEASANPLRLHERARWRETGKSPFGIGLRGTVAPPDRALFWEYRPPYVPGRTILILKETNERPELPLIFLMEAAPNDPTLAPHDWPNLDEAVFSHQGSWSKIRRVKIFGSGAPTSRVLPETIEFQSGGRPRMDLELKGSDPIELSTELFGIRSTPAV